MFLHCHLLDQPDVIGSPLPTSTTTTFSSSISVGMIAGPVIGGITIIVIGVLFILWAVCRHRKRAAPAIVSAFSTSQSVAVPLHRNHAPPVRPAPTGSAHIPPASNSPFHVTFHSGQMSRVITSRPTGKAAGVLIELVMAPPGQRARLNPPPYPALVEPVLSG